MITEPGPGGASSRGPATVGSLLGWFFVVRFDCLPRLLDRQERSPRVPFGQRRWGRSEPGRKSELWQTGVAATNAPLRGRGTLLAHVPEKEKEIGLIRLISYE